MVSSSTQTVSKLYLIKIFNWDTSHHTVRGSSHEVAHIHLLSEYYLFLAFLLICIYVSQFNSCTQEKTHLD